LTVIKGRVEEGRSFRTVSGSRPGGIPDEDIDLPRLQCCEALLGGQRNVLDRIRIPEHGGRNGFAKVDIETDKIPVRVTESKAGNGVVDATVERSSRLHGGQGLAGGCFNSVSASGGRRVGGWGTRCQSQANHPENHQVSSHFSSRAFATVRP
jgi:hypothetical protein